MAQVIRGLSRLYGFYGLEKEGKPLIARDIFIILNIWYSRILYPHTSILLFSLWVHKRGVAKLFKVAKLWN